MIIRSVRTLWLIAIFIAIVVLLLGLPVKSHGQGVSGTSLAIGSPPTPPSGSSVNIKGLGTKSAGQEVVTVDTSGNWRKGLLVPGDIPSQFTRRDLAETIEQLWTFSSSLATPTIRATGTEFSIRDTTGATKWLVASGSSVDIPFDLNVFDDAFVSDRFDVMGLSNFNAEVAINANLRFDGTGRRILGRMDGPVTDRLSFQTSTSNASTTVSALPNGTGPASAFTVYNTSNPTNSAYTMLYADGTYSAIIGGSTGTGTALPLSLFVANSEKMRWNSNDDHIMLGAGTAGIRYNTSSNISGQRWWRHGVYGPNFGLWGGTDDGVTYLPAWHATQSGGRPNGFYWGPDIRDVNPTKNYQTRLGVLNNKYLQLSAAELLVETLVAQDTMATIGGRILVGPTTTLTTDVTTGATQIEVKHNQIVPGDKLYLESGGQVEFLDVVTGPFANGPSFIYGVTRNLDGTEANVWPAGSAVFNTGQPGNGFIDIYSTRGVRLGTEIGPTLVGNIRTAYGYNDWAPRWAIGNLAGLYGNGATPLYGAAFGNVSEVWTQYDSTYGMRGMDGTTQYLIVHPTGYVRVGNPSSRNIYIDYGANIIFYENTIARLWMDTNSIRFMDPGGTVYQRLGAAGATFGYDLTNFGNVHMSNGGQLYMRSGAINRMILDANNGAMTWYRPDGLATMQIRSDVAQFGNIDTGARVQLSTGAVSISKPDGNWFFNVDSSNGLLMGNWYVTDKAYLQIAPDASVLQFCRAGRSCPLIFYGSSGDIQSTGNIYLAGNPGGQILSSGNFVLGNSTGLQFQRWDGGTYQAGRSIQFLTGPGGTLMGEVGMENSGAMRLNSRSYGAGTGIRLSLGNLIYSGIEGGLFMTQQPDGTGGRWTNITAQSISEPLTNALVSISPVKGPVSGVAVATATLGRTGSRWDNIYLALPQAGNPPPYIVTGDLDGSLRYWNHGLGVSGGYGIPVKNHAGTNCYIYVAMGLVYYESCGGAVLADNDPNQAQAVADRLNAERKARGENKLGVKGEPDAPLPRLEPRDVRQPVPVP